MNLKFFLIVLKGLPIKRASWVGAFGRDEPPLRRLNYLAFCEENFSLAATTQNVSTLPVFDSHFHTPHLSLAMRARLSSSRKLLHGSLRVKYGAMKWLLLTFCILASLSCSAQETVKVFFQGDSSRLPDFIESCKREFKERGVDLQVVRPDQIYDYNIVVAQESSVSGAAAAVIALDSKGLFVASVVRSGRWSGKGAFNASAKELAKKLYVLRSH
jgi:hypothetical protein